MGHDCDDLGDDFRSDIHHLVHRLRQLLGDAERILDPDCRPKPPHPSVPASFPTFVTLN